MLREWEQGGKGEKGRVRGRGMTKKPEGEREFICGFGTYLEFKCRQ